MRHLQHNKLYLTKHDSAFTDTAVCLAVGTTKPLSGKADPLLLVLQTNMQHTLQQMPQHDIACCNASFHAALPWLQSLAYAAPVDVYAIARACSEHANILHKHYVDNGDAA